MSLSVICPGCGHRQMLPDDFPRRKVRCPECGVICPVPEATKQPAARSGRARRQDEQLPPARQPARVDRSELSLPEPDHQEDDGRPYLVEGGVEKTCPKCFRVLAEGAVLCVGCGLNLRTGKKLKQSYEPLEREWDLGIQFPVRKLLFGLFFTVSLIVSVATVVAKGEWGMIFVSWLWLIGMLAFLLGTFFHVRLTRDRRGRVRLLRTWRIGFVKWPAAEIDLKDYVGVRMGMSRDAGVFEWLICIYLLLSGALPGILFWYHVIYKDRYHVELTRDHGYGALILYRGTDGKLAEEVTAAIRDAAHLRHETA